MKNSIAQAMKKIVVENSLSFDDVRLYRDDSKDYVLDLINKRAYLVIDNNIILSQINNQDYAYDNSAYTAIESCVEDVINEIYTEKFPTLLDLFKKKNDKLELKDFEEELKKFLLNRFVDASEIIDCFITDKGRDLFRKFRLRFMKQKAKTQENVGNGNGGSGKGKSKDSKSIYISAPPRPNSSYNM